MNLLQTAQQYTAAGLSVIGCNNKIPVGKSWMEYQKNIPTEADLIDMFQNRKAKQIAIICGQVSSNLEVIDVDTKHALEPDKFWDDLWGQICDYFHDKPPFVLVQTQSGGYHILYRCETIEGNKKLASRERKKPQRPICFLETRGEGGYIIAAPSNRWKLLSGSYDKIPTLSIDQRDDVLTICRSFNEVFKEAATKPKKSVDHAYSNTPWEAYNNDTKEPWQDVLNDAGWEFTFDTSERSYWKRPGTENKYSANFHFEKRLFYTFSGNGGLEENKGFTPMAILAFLKFDGDFSKATAHIRELGYGELWTPGEKQAIFEVVKISDSGLTQDDIFAMLASDFPDIKDKPAIVAAAKKKIHNDERAFWYRNKSGTLKLSKYKLSKFLNAEMGYALFLDKANSLSYRLVKVEADKRLIYQSSLGLIKADFIAWVETMDLGQYEIGVEELIEALISVTKSTWESVIEFLPRIDLAKTNMMQDTKNEALIPFKNAVIKINKKTGVSMVRYEDMPTDMLIWRDRIVDFDIDIMDAKKESDLNRSDFYLYLKRIAGVPKEMDAIDLVDLPELYQNKLFAFISTIGYMLHNYKDPARPYCVIIGEDVADQGQGGGTGKSLLFKCIGKLRNLTTLSGKKWDPNKTFALQRVPLGCDILLWDDAKKTFDLEPIYNYITEGLDIEKKNKDEIYIPYEMSPKTAITTNYDIAVDGKHGARRTKLLLVADYFSDTHSPQQEYNKSFFFEWDHNDWINFYNVLFQFISMYLGFGVVDYKETEKSKEKAIKLRYGQSFWDFVEENIKGNTGKWLPIEESFNHFVTQYKPDQLYKSSGRFVYALKYYASKYDMEYNYERKRTKDERGKGFYYLSRVNESVPQMEDTEDDKMPF